MGGTEEDNDGNRDRRMEAVRLSCVRGRRRGVGASNDLIARLVSQKLTDVVGGQINLMYTTSVTGDAHIKAGRIKVLGVADAKRQQALPNVPSLVELGIENAEAYVWFGMSAPAKTPRPILDKLNREVNKALAMADVKQRLEQLGLVVTGGTREKFDAFIKSEADRLTKLIKVGAVPVE